MELDQFCILARSQKGRACAALIQQVLNSKKIYVFGELISIPSVQSLKDTEEFTKHYSTLELFAYGTYTDYQVDKEKYIEFSDLAQRKLKILSLISLAMQQKILSYDDLKAKLEISSTRDLEDLIIETVYLGLMDGKLDQRSNSFRVKSVRSRDVPPSEITTILEKLKAWKVSCAKARDALDSNIEDINIAKVSEKQNNLEIQEKINVIKSSLKLESLSEGSSGRDRFVIRASSASSANGR